MRLVEIGVIGAVAVPVVAPALPIGVVDLAVKPVGEAADQRQVNA